MNDRKRVKLSKSILEMKFMKKTKERVEKTEDDAEGYAMYQGEITEEMKKNGTIVFVDVSIAQCKDLMEGRLSFGGMNPELEKLVESENASKLDEIEKQKEKDVTDMEMAQGYSSLVNTVSKKFQTKANRNFKSRKFQKPDDSIL